MSKKVISLEKRQREYERNHKHVSGVPVIARLDGKSFHTLTKKISAHKPFDRDLIDSMVGAAIIVCKSIQGFKVAYIQSDEVSIVLSDYDTISTQGWFDFRIDKIESILSSVMAVEFSKMLSLKKGRDISAYFACKSFNIPESDVANNLLWRAIDWKRNSLSMYSRSFFSNKQLHGKKSEDMHQMLHEVGKNWATDLKDDEKNGTFLVNIDGKIEVLKNILPTYDSISKIIPKFVKEDSEDAC
jgi:tRNA(His) 5'-end guanylyltransferase